MTETQERFLRTVLTRIELDSVVELHLFPPIRRGTMETGVAVIATVLPRAPLTVVESVPDPVADIAPDIAPDVAMELAPLAATELAADATTDTAQHSDGDEASPYAADSSHSASAVAAPRLRILTAAYRHTIKGVDRGKWAVDVQEEADAPREAVEAVLRGVRHRSSEPADPESVTHDTLAALVAPARVAPAA